jgi:hypothetical protein
LKIWTIVFVVSEVTNHIRSPAILTAPNTLGLIGSLPNWKPINVRFWSAS